MVSSKYLLKATKGKGNSSSRTMTEATSPKKATKEKMTDPSQSKEIMVSSPEKVHEERKKRRHDPTIEAKEPKKQKVAESAIIPSTAVSSSILVFVTDFPPDIRLPRSFDQVDMQKTRVYTTHGPSLSDMKKLTIPNSACTEEKQWLASLSADALHYETANIFEMAS